MPDLIDTEGRTVTLDSDSDVANAISQGWRPATTADSLRRSHEAARHEDYGGVSGGAKALYYGALRGATLGLSDVGLKAIGAGGELKGLQEENPGLSTGAELVGAFAPALASGGAALAGKLGAKGAATALGETGSLLGRTPAGLVSNIGRSIVDAAEQGGAGVVGKAVAGTAGAAAEGALYGGGAYLSQTAIDDKPLAAEGFLGSMGKGALWAAPVGGALSLGESALIRARSLFPKSEMTREAARTVNRDATSALGQSVQDGDAMVQSAKQQIALTKAKMGSSAATEQMTRSMFGAADESSLINQVGGAADKSELASAVERYETGRAKLENWVRAEADPDLERALLRIRTPDVQVGAPKLRAPEFGEVVPPQVENPVLGEFGLERTSVGKRRNLADGTPGPHEPPQVSTTADLPPLPLAGDKTTAFSSKELGLTFDPKTRTHHDANRGAVEAEKFAPSEPGTMMKEPPTGLESLLDMQRRAGQATHAGTPASAPLEIRVTGHWKNREFHASMPDGTTKALADRGDVESLLEAALPPEFRVGNRFIDTTKDAAVVHGLPTDAGTVRPNSLYVAHPSELADRGIIGGDLHQERLTSVETARGEKLRLDPIEIQINKEGKIFLDDGNHRLQYAAKTDSPVAIKFIPVDEFRGFGGSFDVAGRIRDALPKASSAADDSLESLLRSTQQGLASGKSLSELGAPARAEYAATKAEKTAAAAEHFRGEAIAKRAGAPLTESEFASLATERHGTLTPDVARAVDNYTSPGMYKRINEPLREHPELGGTAALDLFKGQGSMGEIVKGIDDGIAASPAPRDMTVYRGIRGERSIKQIGDLKPGDTFTDPGFGSSTYSRDTAKEFAQGHLGKGPVLEIAVPKGHPALPIREGIANKGEGELVLPRGTRYVVSSVGEENGHKIIKMAVQPSAAGDVTEHFEVAGTKLKLTTETKPLVPGGRPRTTVTLTRTLGDGEEVTAGTAEFIHTSEGLYPDHINIEPALQRQGVGTKIYDAVERSTGEKIVQSENQTAAGKAFRAARSEVQNAGPDAELEKLLRGTKGEPAAKSAGPAVEPSAAPAATPGPKKMTLNNIDDFESFFGKDWSKAAPEEWMAEARAMGGGGGARDTAKTIVDGGIKSEMQKVIEDDAINAALRKHNGKNVDIGADLRRAADIIGEHEAGVAGLVDALTAAGVDVPPMAAANAKAYREALASQNQKMGASAARAASDFDAKGGQQTLVDNDITKALRAHESKSEGGARRAAVSLTKAETKEAAKQALVPARGKGALSVAADVGTALEVLHAMGVHTPDLAAIPVIGPLLSLYLKARAVVGIMGRKGGSIGRSAESVVAAKASAVRDRVAKATAAMLDIGAKAARKASPIAGPVGALAYKLFPGDGDTKSKDPRVLYDARMAELARAQQPGAIDQAVSDRVRTSDPDLQSALTAQAQRATDFLASKAPRPPMLQPMVPGDGIWHPGRTALEQWSRYVAAVHDPAGVLEDLANGHVTAEAAETLRVVYPALYAEAQRRLLEHAADYTKTLPYSRRVSLSIMFRVPVDGTVNAQHLQFLQTGAPQPAPGSQPSGGGAPAITAPLQLGQQTMTPFDRRAGA